MVYQHATRQVGDGTGIVILRWPAGQRHKAERVTRSMVLDITSRPLIALDSSENIAFKLGAEGEQAAATLAAQLTLWPEAEITERSTS